VVSLPFGFLKRAIWPLRSNQLPLAGASAQGLGRVKTQRRANCREKYFFESPLWERKERTELRRRRI
jgi:hypothetical protein